MFAAIHQPRTLQQACRPGLLRGLLLVVGLALLLGGCTTRFFYDRIDALVVWRLGSFVTLTDEQNQALKADIQAHLDDVRVNDMTRVAAFIDEVAREFEAGPVTAEQLDARWQEVMTVYDEVMLGMVPLTERFLRDLSEEQVDEFFSRLDEANDEMYEEFLGRTADERDKARNKSAVRGVENFTGRLSKEQKLLVTDSLERMDDASDEWVVYQRQWRTQFRELVVESPEGAEYTARLTRLMVYPRSLHSAEYRRRVDGNRAIFNAMFSELSQGLTDKQRRKAVKKLDGYVEFLQNLAESGRAS